MRLLEAIVDANQRATSPTEVSLDLHPYAESLPIIALTCIDPRLNRLFPEALGVSADQFIWLRNAGNIIFDPMSSMTRTLALACAIKGGKEIAIIGHTDCKVGKVSMVELTDRFRAMGVDRSKLPDNLNEFFGMFASERQNVMRAADLIRHSPLIGMKVPVHGLLIDVQTGKLEWIVNGYETLSQAVSQAAVPANVPGPLGSTPLSEFKIGEMKFPETKIGEAVTRAAERVAAVAQKVETVAEKVTQTIQQHTRSAGTAPDEEVAGSVIHTRGQPRFHPGQMYKVMGDDKKVYGPVLGKEVERWLAEGRIDLNTLAQKVGYKNWRPLAEFLEETESRPTATPPAIPFDPKRFK